MEQINEYLTEQVKESGISKKILEMKNEMERINRIEEFVHSYYFSSYTNDILIDNEYIEDLHELDDDEAIAVLIENNYDPKYLLDTVYGNNSLNVLSCGCDLYNIGGGKQISILKKNGVITYKDIIEFWYLGILHNNSCIHKCFQGITRLDDNTIKINSAY